MKRFVSLFGNNWLPLLVGVIAYFVTDHVKLMALEKSQEKQDQYIEQLKEVAVKLEVLTEKQDTIIKILMEERKGK